MDKHSCFFKSTLHLPIMKEKITLAIYDENRLQKELLHHQLEHIRFEVLYSTMNPDELHEYFAQRPADVLLVNGANNLLKFTARIKNLRKRKGKLKVIFYNMEFDESLLPEMKKIKGTELFFIPNGWANILNKIEELNQPESVLPKKEIISAARIATEDPFFKLSENKKFIDILRYLKEGKSARQIAYLLGTSINNVNYHIKKMHDETGSNTTKMVADAMKAGLI